MADDPNDIANRGLDSLFKGQDILGAPSDIRLSGTGALPGGGAAAALPAPAGPGGVAGGFLGGSRGQQGGGGPDSLGTAKQALEAAYKTGTFGQGLFGPDLGTRGNVGGEGTTQDSSTSLSDRLRTGADIPNFAGTTAELYGPQLATMVGNTSPTAYFNSLTSAGLTPAQANDVMSMMTQDPEVFKALGSMGSLGSEAGSAAGAAGSLGTAAGGAGALGAILGLIASLTGNQDLGTAATAVGGAASGIGTGAALAGAGSGIAGTGATSALGAVAAPAAVLTAPIVGTLLLDSLFSKKGEDIVSSTMQDYAGDYPTWNQAKLMPAERQQGIALETLQKALPYVQSQEELGQLLNSYKNYLTTTSGAPLTGGQEGIYGLQTIPGTGPVTHGQQTPSFNWGPQTQQLQSQIDQLLGVLPGQRITAQYGQPGGGLEGEPARRLWEQFIQQGTGELPPTAYNSVSGEFLPVYGAQPGQYSEQDLLNAVAQGNLAPGAQWDPATGQFVGVLGGQAPPSPADYFKVAPYMAQLRGASGAPQTAVAQGGLNALGQGHGAFDVNLSDEQKRAMGLI